MREVSITQNKIDGSHFLRNEYAVSHFMAIDKNDPADIEIPDKENLEGLDDTTDWKAKADELQTRHQEAGIRNRERTKALKERMSAIETELAEFKKPPEKKEDKKSFELGYDHKAFLIAKGIEEFDLIGEEMKKFTGTLEELIENPYFKQRLETVRTEKANANATDIQGNRRGEGGGRNTAEYWLAKLKPDEQVPADLPRELREKIVAARREQGKSKKMFYNE